MKLYGSTLILFISLVAKSQTLEDIRKIDSIVFKINNMASAGMLDTLQGGLLNEGNTTSNIFFLKLDLVISKIAVVNETKGYIEQLIF